MAQCKKNSRITETDHNGLLIDMELKAGKCRSDRSEMFNFKSKSCQDAFFEETDSNKELLKCFADDNETVAGQASRWRKTFKNILHKCSQKIRIVKRKQQIKSDEILKERIKLKN